MTNGSNSEERPFRFDLIAIGNITLDQVCKVDRIPKKNETGLIIDAKTCFGGRAANVALTLTMLGLRVALMSVAGRDFRTTGYMDFLNGNKVNVDHVMVLKDRDSASIKAYYTEGGNLLYFFNPIVTDSLVFPLPSKTSLSEARLVYITPFDGDSWTERLLHLVRGTQGVVVALGEEVYRKESMILVNIVKSSRFLLLNSDEFKVLMKKTKVNDARELFEINTNLECIAVTEGKSGSNLLTRHGAHHVRPVAPQRFVNALGAGDAYAAGFLYGLSRSFELRKCGEIASTVASFALEVEGAQPDSINTQKVMSRLKSETDWFKGN